MKKFLLILAFILTTTVCHAERMYHYDSMTSQSYCFVIVRDTDGYIWSPSAEAFQVNPNWNARGMDATCNTNFSFQYYITVPPIGAGDFHYIVFDSTAAALTAASTSVSGYTFSFDGTNEITNYIIDAEMDTITTKLPTNYIAGSHIQGDGFDADGRVDVGYILSTTPATVSDMAIAVSANLDGEGSGIINDIQQTGTNIFNQLTDVNENLSQKIADANLLIYATHEDTNEIQENFANPVFPNGLATNLYEMIFQHWGIEFYKSTLAGSGSIATRSTYDANGVVNTTQNVTYDGSTKTVNKAQ